MSEMMERLRDLLRESRQYVSDAGLGCEDDNEVKIHSEALLALIDQALAGSPQAVSATEEHARNWLRKRWGQDWPNEGHVRQLAEYAASLRTEPKGAPLPESPALQGR